MRSYVPLGQVPHDEACTQPGDPNYRLNALRECNNYMQAIRRYLGMARAGTELGVLPIPHDGWTEYEVVCYHRDDPASKAEAELVARQAPHRWEEAGMTAPQKVAAAQLSR